MQNLRILAGMITIGVLLIPSCVGSQGSTGSPPRAADSPTVQIGQGAEVSTDPGGNQGFVDLGVTVKAIERGNRRDLKNLDNIEGDKIPFYLRVQYINVAGAKYGSTISNDFAVYQSDGNVAVPLLVIGDFAPCNDDTPPKSFARKKR